MKENEIRIGNLLKWKDNGQEFDVTIGLMLSKGFWKHIKQGDIISIPLTEEWLLKFGFKSLHPEYWVKDWVHIGFFKKDDDEETHFLWIYNNEKKNSIIIQKYYVHQLQNLYFALTNEELK